MINISIVSTFATQLSYTHFLTTSSTKFFSLLKLAGTVSRLSASNLFTLYFRQAELTFSENCCFFYFKF